MQPVLVSLLGMEQGREGWRVDLGEDTEDIQHRGLLKPALCVSL